MLLHGQGLLRRLSKWLLGWRLRDRNPVAREWLASGWLASGVYLDLGWFVVEVDTGSNSKRS